MDPRARRIELIALIRRLSYREGEFTLASGKKSPFYVDLKATTLHPDGAALIGELAVELLERESLAVEGVGGLTLGADPLATAVSLAARARGKSWPAFIVRKEAKDHGTRKCVEGAANLRPGARVLVLEDVATTGGSSLQAIEKLKAEGFEPVGVLAVVDREQGAREAFRKLGLAFFALTTLSEIRSSAKQG
jgi:orotate phosphoribosyltransferase